MKKIPQSRFRRNRLQHNKGHILKKKSWLTSWVNPNPNPNPNPNLNPNPIQWSTVPYDG